jgi:hypothetical protein
VATFGLTPEERELLEQAGDDSCLVNVLIHDGQRQEDGFARERACQRLAERGLLRFLGWVGAPSRGAVWSSRWSLTDAARRGLARGDVRGAGPDWIRSLRDSSSSD